MKDKGIIIVHDKDVVNRPFYINGEMTLLSLLKDCGLPVTGVLLLRLDPRYEYTTTRNELSRSTSYEWKIKD